MNIRDLVYDVIVEEVKNKKLFNFLLKKWFGDTPTSAQMRRAEMDLTLFSEKQKGLTPKNPAVFSFLLRHDGNHGLPAFDPSKLMDISQYSLEEIESLLHEFKDEALTTQEDEFAGKLDSSPEKVAASKKLWSSDRDVVVDEGGFKVHFVSDARESIKYGYYQQKLAEKLRGANGTLGQQWCVTGRHTSDSRGNLWGTYRPTRTFWFVVDESKNPKDNENWEVFRYYLSALQYCVNSTDSRGNRYDGFKLTSLLNDGDNLKTWEQVVEIYPQLAEHREEFETFVKYDEGELLNRDTISRITETPGRNEFAAARREIKKAYIERGGTIKTERSWLSMDTKLREIYITTTTSRDVIDKFQSYELMTTIKMIGSEFNLLNKHIKSLGSRLDENGRIVNQNMSDLGVGVIYQHLMREEFIVARSSIDNPVIQLLNSKVNKKSFGLYHFGKNNWVIHDGITFEPPYNENNTLLYVDDQGKDYLVESYVKNNGDIDNTTLYCVYPVNDENELGKGHFIGAKKWDELSSKMHPKNEDEDNDTQRITDFNPETDVDIRETH
jgi:hypothetical protein